MKTLTLISLWILISGTAVFAKSDHCADRQGDNQVSAQASSVRIEDQNSGNTKDLYLDATEKEQIDEE